MELRLAAILMVLLCSATDATAWSLFSSSPSKKAPPPQLDAGIVVADFSIDGGGKDPRGAKLMENARRRIAAGPATCWNAAYGRLFASCADIMADKELQSRLARRQQWHLSSCFQEDSGRPPLPNCDERSDMVHCRKRLTDSEEKVFLEFFLETNTLCHQLQAEAFKHSTERLVNNLSSSSKAAQEKLEVIEERSERLLQESENIHDSLSSIAAQTDNLTAASKAIGDQMGHVMEQSKAISEQSKEIARAQEELKAGQEGMRDAVDAGMAMVEESYRSLGDGMDRLKEGAGEHREGDQGPSATSCRPRWTVLQQTGRRHWERRPASRWRTRSSYWKGQEKAVRGLTDLYSFLAKATCKA
ncbi:hypothetical protein PR202_ga28877 [Eleusine coracana subsp. coracana]|uniref:Uncharacterized protein n=1 Tax=Eleusine coracana subsp. coracana TaxID=191504 RepID=A0AAV5DKK7_ELECO|nr:hypothetical protein PR202_ga28877 [Eleusine coracana subsp. coracana]